MLYDKYVKIKLKKKKEIWIEYYCKDIILGFGDEGDQGKASKSSSLMKKEAVEDSPLCTHSLSGARLAMEREEGFSYMAWTK